MATWHALIATRDLPGYPTGSVVSYGTVAPSAEELASAGLELVSLGEQGRGVNWSQFEFDATTRRLVPRVIPSRDPQADETIAEKLEDTAAAVRARPSQAASAALAAELEATAATLRNRPGGTGGAAMSGGKR